MDVKFLDGLDLLKKQNANRFSVFCTPLPITDSQWWPCNGGCRQ